MDEETHTRERSTTFEHQRTAAMNELRTFSMLDSATVEKIHKLKWCLTVLGGLLEEELAEREGTTDMARGR